MSGTSSAVPDELIAYGATMFTEAEVVLARNSVQGELDALLASSGTYLADGLPDIEAEVSESVRLAQELDVWVTAVGQAFLEAGGGHGGRTTADDAEIISLLPPGLADPPAETRRRSEEGATLFDELRAATDERDHDRIEELLATLEDRQEDPAFMAGFAVRAEESLGDLDELEGMIADGLRPENRSGILGGVVDFFAGAWDAVWGTLTFLHGLTTQVVLDPGRWAENWGNLGSGLWHGITNPIEFLEAIVDWEGLKDNPERWLGSFVPDLAVTIFSGGAGATARGARSARSLDELADLADSARRLDGANDAGALRHLDDGTPWRGGLDLDADLADVATAMREGLLERGYPTEVADRISGRITSGTQFNRNNWDRYTFNEVRLTNGRVLDSYDPVMGEVVSRKYTQLSEIQVATARTYIDELARKYPEDATVANSPSVLAQEAATGQEIAGTQIVGQRYLEVPAQVDAIPEEILDYARSRNVVIRTPEGVVLNQ